MRIAILNKWFSATHEKNMCPFIGQTTLHVLLEPIIKLKEHRKPLKALWSTFIRFVDVKEIPIYRIGVVLS